MKIKLLLITICLKLCILDSTSMFLRNNNSTTSSQFTKIRPLINKKKFELEEKRIILLQNKLSEYLKNTDQFINSNSNKDIFIALFSNFTQMNGEILYHQYMNERHNKDIQNLIDKLNNFQSNNNEKWYYDTLSNKFSLPDDSNIVV